MMFLRRFGLSALAWLALALSLGVAPLAAAELRAPTGEIILTVDGMVGTTNADGKAVFDRDMLEELGMTSIKTSTPWYDDAVEFEGVLVQRVLDLVGAQGTEVVAVALNDYRTTIPISDFKDHGVILALKSDGEYMPVSDKGPLFIVYPYDSDPKLHSQQYYARSIWQLARLTVR